MAFAQTTAAAAPVFTGQVPARRVVRIRAVLAARRPLPLSAGRPGTRRPQQAGDVARFLTRAQRQRLVSRLWIGAVLLIWAVLMIYAGRDGIKPQDPALVAPLPHMIRK